MPAPKTPFKLRLLRPIDHFGSWIYTALEAMFFTAVENSWSKPATDGIFAICIFALSVQFLTWYIIRQRVESLRPVWRKEYINKTRMILELICADEDKESQLLEINSSHEQNLIITTDLIGIFLSATSLFANYLRPKTHGLKFFNGWNSVTIILTVAAPLWPYIRPKIRLHQLKKNLKKSFKTKEPELGNDNEEFDEAALDQPTKRPRGRPRKHVIDTNYTAAMVDSKAWR